MEALQKPLTKSGQLAISGDNARTFSKYKLMVGLPIALANTGLLCLSPLLCAVLVAAKVGFVYGVLTAPLAAGAALVVVAYSSLLGNKRLKRTLAKRLGVDTKTWEFVGLCSLDNNDAFKLRVETDDNVGFIRMTEDALHIVTEGGALIVRQEDLRGFALERVAALPYLPWIRIECEGAVPSFLLMSREAFTISRQRKCTLDLYARLVDWHAAKQLAWHEARYSALSSGGE